MYQENIRIGGDFEFFRAEIINPQIDSMDSIQSSIPSMQDDFCRQNEGEIKFLILTIFHLGEITTIIGTKTYNYISTWKRYLHMSHKAKIPLIEEVKIVQSKKDDC